MTTEQAAHLVAEVAFIGRMIGWLVIAFVFWALWDMMRS